jgi:hypothetical protein
MQNKINLEHSIERIERLNCLQILNIYYPYICNLNLIYSALIDYYACHLTQRKFLRHIGYLNDLGLISATDFLTSSPSIGLYGNAVLTSKGVDFLSGYLSYQGISQPL